MDGKINIDKTRLQLVIEQHKSQSGETYYVVSCACGRLCFRKLDSVLDLLNNNSFGYV